MLSKVKLIEHLTMKGDNKITAEQQKEIERLLHSAEKDKRVLCSGALAIAKALEVSSKEVGCVADNLKIKISQCQLGCF